ncbi:eukaryotic translation initiation factor 3 subunit G-domain-containing protein [Lipomyces oligophaga]|uniref:eukaryotic translation initiation factor 3 subunit G-domain-containing protein n=1 Tax=Lipomyces oligophaga TaxID=45792 RepID=UPI0034CFDBFE
MPDIATKGLGSWADDEDDENGFPAPLVTQNPDGTKTVISFRVNPETGKKVKVTQKIKTTIVKEHVNADVAERKRWAKFGLERNSAPGPDTKTTTVAENIPLKLVVSWKESKDDEDLKPKEAPKSKGLKCRTCGGDHFTARCPYMDRLSAADPAASDSNSSTPRSGTPEPTSAGARGGATTGRYVPPHLRNGGATGGRGFGDRSSMLRERDDSASLRVSNLGEDVTEDELRLKFEKYGRIQRIFLPTDRETGNSKGYAYVSYIRPSDADTAIKMLNGRGFQNLIMRVEFAQQRK